MEIALFQSVQFSHFYPTSTKKTTGPI